MSYWTLVLQDGSELPLDGSAGLALRHISGHGMPPITTISSEYALRDGALYQRQKTQPRTVQMLIVATDAQECGLRASRERLLTAINPHRLHLPITLCYYDGKGDRRSLCCYYDGGMDGDWEMPYNNEEIVLRLIAFQPYWSGPAAITDTLDVYDTLANVDNILTRTGIGGVWDNMNNGSDARITQIIVDNSGNVYACGDFDNIGGVACSHIAMWNGTIWAPLAAGADSILYDMTIAASGTLYAVGLGRFAGAGTYFGAWNGAAWTSTVASAEIRCITIGDNGYIYIGGDFISVNAVPAVRVAYYDGAWNPLAGGVNALIRDIGFAPNQDLYIVGDFTTVDGNAWARIAMWDGTWHQVGGDINAEVDTLAIASNGDVYIGGNFTDCAGVSCARIAKWNGASWSALGTGLNGQCLTLEFSDAGDLYAGGLFTTAGGLPVTGGIAVWRNGLWTTGDAGGALGGGYIDAIAFDGDALFIGGFFSFNPYPVPGSTLIDNLGNARGYPVFTITGPGRIYYLINNTTSQALYFDLTLLTGEILTIDLSPGVKTVTSSFRGNLISGVLAGALVTWYLAPGNNYIGCYVNDVTAAGTYTYIPFYWGID